MKQTGSEITGRVIYPWSIIKISSGRANGNKLRFTQHVWEGLNFEDEGELVGQELQYRATGFDHKWHDHVAHAVPAGEGNPPPPFPLPEPGQVPANGLALTPPMGWNSWNKFGLRVNDALIREMADRIAGWEGQRDSAGALHANSKFPE